MNDQRRLDDLERRVAALEGVPGETGCATVFVVILVLFVSVGLDWGMGWPIARGIGRMVWGG